MFKKLVLLSAFLLIAGVAWASPANRTIITETQLDDSPTSITGTWNIQDYEKVGFFIKVDETQVGNSVSVAVTIDFSYDNSNWVTGSWFDLAGGVATLQTSETISSDGWYFGWLDPNWKIPYVRITLTATNTDADDLAVVTAYLVGNK